MSSCETSVEDIVKHGGLELLIGFLWERPPDAATEAELTACEHVQQKAAIAVTRLCKEHGHAQAFVNLKGTHSVTKTFNVNFKWMRYLIALFSLVCLRFFFWIPKKKNL